jgi:tetratricopeptide (TPR) repeat protein
MANLGFTRFALRQYDGAEAILRRALIADRENEGAAGWLLATLVAGRGDTAAGRAFLNTISKSAMPQLRNGGEELLARLGRHFDAASAATGLDRALSPIDEPSNLLARALNDVAAGATARARARADSAARLVRAYLARTTGGDVFGNRAAFHTALGVAEAISGDGPAAIRDGERAVQLNPSSRDATEGPNSLAGLIVIHLLLGRRDDAIRLITAAAQEPIGTQGIMPITQAMIRLDPIFDGIREDPRMRALLQSDAAWVVR